MIKADMNIEPFDIITTIEMYRLHKLMEEKCKENEIFRRVEEWIKKMGSRMLSVSGSFTTEIVCQQTGLKSADVVKALKEYQEMCMESFECAKNRYYKLRSGKLITVEELEEFYQALKIVKGGSSNVHKNSVQGKHRNI